MTALLRRSDPWSVQPGWGIVVDLTPPELLNVRQLRAVRRIVLAALVAVAVLLASVYLLIDQKRSSAQDELANAQTATIHLQQQQQKYSGVTKLKAAAQQIKVQIGSLMSGDVASDALLYRMLLAVPTGVHLESVSVTINQAGVANAQNAQGGAPGAIEISGHSRIGTVTMNGKAAAMDEVSTYVDRLSAIPGVLDVVPTSNSRDAGGGEFTISFGLDDRLLTHHFDVKAGK